MNRGILVSFEGIDGCGKTTQAKLFHRYLKKNGVPVVIMKEPGGTPAGEQIRRLLLSGKHSISPWCELFLYLASRAQLLADFIVPHLKKNSVVILDRHVDSTVAYQGYGRSLPVPLIDEIHRSFMQGITPALTFLIDAPPEKLADILQAKGRDRIEKESMAFQRKVRAGYLRTAARNKRIKIIPRRTVEQTFVCVRQEWEKFRHEHGRG